MPVNKEALIRYRVIDECLRNKRRPYPTLEFLTEKCSEVLGKNCSSSTIQKDILAMRTDLGLGYEAPIKWDPAKKGYHYTDQEYSISRAPLDENQAEALELVTGMLQQFHEFRFMKEAETAIRRIEQAAHISRAIGNLDYRDIIQVEQPVQHKGIEWFDPLLRSILERQAVIIHYQVFQKPQPLPVHIHPYLLKEYRNRWYIIGFDTRHHEIRTYGLDRIVKTEATNDHFERHPTFDAKTWFRHSFGITVNKGKHELIVLTFQPLQGEYLLTNPIHPTQQLIRKTKKGITISIDVVPATELMMQLLSYGANVKVVKPAWLKKEIRAKAEAILAQYGK